MLGNKKALFGRESSKEGKDRELAYIKFFPNLKKSWNKIMEYESKKRTNLQMKENFEKNEFLNSSFRE